MRIRVCVCVSVYWRCNEFYGTSVSSSESVCGHVITYHTYRRIPSLLFKGTNFCKI